MEVMATTDAEKSAKTLTMVIYALYAASFLLGITAIVAIVINYVKKGDVAGTFLESHFRWQIRTFWFALLWLLLGAVLVLTVIGIPLAWALGGAMLLTLGILGGAPLYVPTLLKMFGRGVGLTGPTARLAATNAVRNPGRASATATAAAAATWGTTIRGLRRLTTASSTSRSTAQRAAATPGIGSPPSGS